MSSRRATQNFFINLWEAWLLKVAVWNKAKEERTYALNCTSTAYHILFAKHGRGANHGSGQPETKALLSFNTSLTRDSWRLFTAKEIGSTSKEEVRDSHEESTEAEMKWNLRVFSSQFLTNQSAILFHPSWREQTQRKEIKDGLILSVISEKLSAVYSFWKYINIILPPKNPSFTKNIPIGPSKYYPDKRGTIFSTHNPPRLKKIYWNPSRLPQNRKKARTCPPNRSLFSPTKDQ